MTGLRLPLRMHPRMHARRRGVAAARVRVRRTAVLTGIAGVAALAAMWWILTGPAVAIRSVTVKGYTRPDVAVLDAYVQRATSTGTMLDLPIEELRSQLRQFPWVAEVLVERDWPTGIRVDIIQAQPALVVRAGSRPAGVLAHDGRLLGGATGVAAVGSLPRLQVTAMPERIGGELRRPEERAAATFVGTLPEIPGNRLASIAVNANGGLVGRMASGLELRLGTAEMMEQKALAVAAVLPLLGPGERGGEHYLDVRLPRNPAHGKVSLGGPTGGPAPGRATSAAGTSTPEAPATPSATAVPAAGSEGAAPAAPSTTSATAEPSSPQAAPSSPAPATASPSTPVAQPSTSAPGSGTPEPPGGSNSGP